MLSESKISFERPDPLVPHDDILNMGILRNKLAGFIEINMTIIDTCTRHKLFWYKPTQRGDLSAIPYPLINVGKVVAQFISVRTIGKHIGLDVEEYFKRLIGESSQEYWGVKGVSLTNIGIMLEPELSLNVEKILMDLSREYAIVIVWPYQVENSRRLVWDDTAKISLDFPDQTIHRLEV